jgi:hypothetical protein
MKANIKNTLGGMLLISLLTIGCKKDTEDINSMPESTTDSLPADDIGVQQDNGGSASYTNAQSQQTSGSANASNPSAKSVKTSTSKDRSGYSAADGTDDENNDGDMYTKNDKRMMPSGSTSIK